MKSIVVREIIALVFRPAAPVVPVPTASSKHIRFGDAPAKVKGTQSSDKRKDFANIHAAYYATITFNQIVLSPSTEDREVARHLINVYFDLFKDLLGSADTVLNDEPSVAEHETPPARKGSMRQGKAGPKETRGSAGFAEVEDSNSRHISAILTGVNRALPFAKLSPSDAKYVLKTLCIACQLSCNPFLQVQSACQHAFPHHPYVDLQYFFTSTTTTLPNCIVLGRKLPRNH